MSRKQNIVSMEPEALRLELKTWEQAFLKANRRKPGRDDIKKNAEIGAVSTARAEHMGKLTSRCSGEVQKIRQSEKTASRAADNSKQGQEVHTEQGGARCSPRKIRQCHSGNAK